MITILRNRYTKGSARERPHLWAQQWRTNYATGDTIVVRYADDFVVGFQHRREAERFLRELGERFEKFGLALHPE